MKKNVVSYDVPGRPIRLSTLEILKRHQLLAFFVLAFAIAWGGWFLLLALQSSNLPAFKWNTDSLALPLPAFLIFRITAYSPAIAALILTALIGGKQGLRSFFSRFVCWRVGPQWYAVALFSFVPMSLAIAGLYTLLVGPLPGTPFLATWYSPFLWLIPLIGLGVALAALPEDRDGVAMRFHSYFPATIPCLQASSWVSSGACGICPSSSLMQIILSTFSCFCSRHSHSAFSSPGSTLTQGEVSSSVCSFMAQ